MCDEILVVNDGMIQTRGTADEIWPLIKGDIECKMKDQCRGEMGYEN